MSEGVQDPGRSLNPYCFRNLRPLYVVLIARGSARRTNKI